MESVVKKKEEFMDCPRCKVSLQVGDYEGERVSMCTDCGGVLMKQKSLTAVLSRLAEDLMGKVLLNSRIEKIEDAGSIKFCPECRSRTEYYGYMGSNKVKLDYCRNCGSLWVDPLEFLTMAKMYLRLDLRSQDMRDNAYRGSDVVGVHMLTEAFAKAFSRRFWAVHTSSHHYSHYFDYYDYDDYGDDDGGE